MTRADGGSHVALLGGLRLICRGIDVDLPPGPQRLLAYLALSDRSLQRAFVAGILWPNVGDARARASLRTAIWRLGHGVDNIVEATATHLRLSHATTVDLRTASNLAHDVMRASRPPDAPELVVQLLSHDILPDWSDEWVTMHRDCFHQLRLHALESVCEQLAAVGSYGLAAEAGTLALAGDPLRESAHRALIDVYVAEGNVSDAVRQYRKCRELLSSELGVHPSADLEQEFQDFS